MEYDLVYEAVRGFFSFNTCRLQNPMQISSVKYYRGLKSQSNKTTQVGITKLYLPVRLLEFTSP
jgi:hypothetical protein